MRVRAQDDAALYLPTVAKAAEVQSLETRVAALEHKLHHVTASADAITVTAANLWVVNGTGATSTTNGLGNVILGYNESRRNLGGGDQRGVLSCVGSHAPITREAAILVPTLSSPRRPGRMAQGGQA